MEAYVSAHYWACQIRDLGHEVWCGRVPWCHLAPVIDYCSRELLGWRLAKNGNLKQRKRHSKKP